MSMRATRIDNEYLYYLIYGSGYIDNAWSHIWGSNDYFNDHWELFVRPTPTNADVGLVDMSIESDPQISVVYTQTYTYNSSGGLDYTTDAGNADLRTADRLTLDHQDVGSDASFKLALQGVEFIDAPVDNLDTHLQIITKNGFETDGTLASLTMHVGHQTMTFTGAARDSTIFMGPGYDTIDFVDHLDVPGEQFWSVIRRPDGELDVYSLFSGYRVQLGGGYKGWTAESSDLMNYGEIEEISLRDSRNGGTDAYLPGVDLPDGGDRGTATNIDLRSDGELHSDSFNMAYFNFIRYTSDNVWAGEATVHDGTPTGYSTPSDRTVKTAKYGVQAPDLTGTMSVIGSSRNGTHDLIVAEQATAIDGHLRVYSFNVTSGLYNEFNEVYLGTSLADTVDKSDIEDDWSDRVALYGFGGNDTLTGGAGRDYLFGAQSVYNLTVSGATGNQVTGGEGADYFGVGNTNSAGVVTGANTAIGTTTTTAEFLQGYATDVILDWHAGEDTLVVLTNGVAVIGGLRNGDGLVSLSGANTIDLRDYAAVATSDQDFDGARGGDIWDANVNGATPLEYVFLNQATRDSHSIKNEADRTIVNEGLIVIRGLDGSDTIYGSADDDYIYGNNAGNDVHIGNGGNDRVYYDAFDGSAAKHFVTGFTVADDGAPVNATEADKFFVNKRVIDAFKSDEGYSDRGLIASDVTGDYVRSQAYNPGLNFLHSPFYNPSIASPNAVHNSEDGEAYYEDGSGGSDQTSSLIGLGMVAAGRILLSVPFVGPIIGIPLIASGTLLNGVGFEVITTTRHLNATYDGDVGAYLNVLSDTGTSTPNGQLLEPTHSLTGLDTSIRFHQFFEAVDAGDDYIPVVEFTKHSGEGLYGYFALHSATHTFVYLVASKDNLIENSEAILVAQIEGLLKAEDFAIYDGQADIYNPAVQASIVIREPTVTKLGDDTIDNILSAEEKRFDDVDNPLKLTVTVPGDVRTGQIRLYDGVTLIFDSASATPTNSNVTLLTPVFDPDSAVTTFVLQDARNIGTVAQQTDAADIGEDNQFILRDSIVNYTVEFVDSVTKIGTRDTVGRVDVAGGDVIIDGGDGANDMLTIFETNDFINNATNEKILKMEKILIVAEQDPDTEVYVPITLKLSEQSDGFYIVSGDSGDIIIGSSGADTIFGGGGADSINTSAGDDTVVYSTEFVVDSEGDLTSAISSTANVQISEDTLLVGGDGSDTLKFDTDFVASDGTVSQKINVVLSDSDFATVSKFEAILLNGTGSQTLTLGSAASEAFIAGLTVTANTAGDGLVFSAADAGWTRTTNVTGADNADTLTGGVDVDILNGGGGNDSLTGGAGADALTGGAGADVFVLGGNDTVVDFNSTEGDTVVNTALVNGDVLTFSTVTGTLDLSGSVSTASFTATAAASGASITGGAGGDNLTGSSGNDTLFGGGGNDTLIGGAGDDFLAGDAGADTFVVGSVNSFGIDAVFFDQGDKIRYSKSVGEAVVGEEFTAGNPTLAAALAEVALENTGGDGTTAAIAFRYSGGFYILITTDEVGSAHAYDPSIDAVFRTNQYLMDNLSTSDFII